MRAGTQATLFDTGTSLPNGFVYRPEFLTPQEEADIIGYIEDLPLSHSYLGEYVSKRRVIGFGWGYDFREHTLIPGPPLPPFLQPLQRRIGKWLDIPHTRVVEALITEYTPGSAIGWHRDNESFDAIVGISLSGWCRMRLRPLYRTKKRHPKEVLSLPLEPRSAYLLQKESRWDFQHSIPSVGCLRYSITFRTLPKELPTPRTSLRRSRRTAGADRDY